MHFVLNSTRERFPGAGPGLKPSTNSECLSAEQQTRPRLTTVVKRRPRGRNEWLRAYEILSQHSQVSRSDFTKGHIFLADFLRCQSGSGLKPPLFQCPDQCRRFSARPDLVGEGHIDGDTELA